MGYNEIFNEIISQLSKLLDCNQEYVSKILKGQENLTLETMAKIEQCLKIQIFNINLD